MSLKIDVISKLDRKTFRTPGLSVTFDAAKLTDAIAESVLAHLTSSAEEGASGTNPATGSAKPSLSESYRKQAAKGKRPSQRGVTSKGRFIRSFTRTKSRGSRKAKASIKYQAYFDNWLQKEARRGSYFFQVEGEVEEIIEAVIAYHLEEVFK